MTLRNATNIIYGGRTTYLAVNTELYGLTSYSKKTRLTSTHEIVAKAQLNIAKISYIIKGKVEIQEYKVKCTHINIPYTNK